MAKKNQVLFELKSFPGFQSFLKNEKETFVSFRKRVGLKNIKFKLVLYNGF